MPIRLTQVGSLMRYPMVAFNGMLKIATQVEAPTYRDIYESAGESEFSEIHMTCANRIGMVDAIPNISHWAT